jgi:hypothetical protein
MELLAIAVILFAVYMTPWIIASNWRDKPNQMGFFFLNLLLNWTVIMWFVCLIIAFTGKGGKELERERAAADRQLAALEELARNSKSDAVIKES